MTNAEYTIQVWRLIKIGKLKLLIGKYRQGIEKGFILNKEHFKFRFGIDIDDVIQLA